MQTVKLVTPRFSARTTLALGATLAITGLLYANASLAQPTPAADGTDARPHKGPRPEAIAACKSLVSNDVCTFEAPRGTVKGTCFAPEGKPLACRPNDAPLRGEHKPKTAQ
jgi:hypothetical protein